MATLVSADYTQIKMFIRADAAAWPVFKTLGLTKAQFYVIFQAIEDYLVNAFANRPAGSLKAAIDAASSPIVLTNAQARVLIKFWFMWRFGKDF
jgi:hypothetical protein